jgi:hypothetical protein
MFNVLDSKFFTAIVNCFAIEGAYVDMDMDADADSDAARVCLFHNDNHECGPVADQLRRDGSRFHAYTVRVPVCALRVGDSQSATRAVALRADHVGCDFLGQLLVDLRGPRLADPRFRARTE